MAIANVALTDTFDYWRTVTNSLVVGMNDKLVYFGTANANSISITPNASRSGNVFINVMPTSVTTDQSTSNIASIYAVNTVLQLAVAAYNSANNVAPQLAPAFNQANAAYQAANAVANTITSATGGGTDSIFYLNDTTLTTNYSIPTDKNALSGGPLTINTGVEITINVGSTWTIV